MKKFLRGLGKFLLTTFIILTAFTVLILAGVWGYQQFKNYQLGKYIESLPKDPFISTDVMVELYGDETIGDDKMTIGEKVAAGLNPYVLDTSGNGVPDWEAINTYNTDPKKFSTADDGISDLAKIKEGLDPTKPIDLESIEPFTVENNDLGVRIDTKDLNVKYHTFIESYQHSELDSIYDPVRPPVQLFNYKGEVELSIPDTVTNPEKLRAYYFDFDKEQFVEIKKQTYDNFTIIASIDRSDPVYIIDPGTLEKIDKYYYFRVSGFQFSRAVAGFDHKVFIFKKGKIDSKTSTEERLEHADYGITELSISKIGIVSAAILDGVFSVFDRIFEPLDGTDGRLLQRALIDYGTVIGTPEYVKEHVIPWQYKDFELEFENENSWKVVDSGFRPHFHSFKFGNMMTEIGDGGICAGYCRVTERIYNGQGVETELSFEPEHWRSKLGDWFGGGKLSGLSYNLEPQMEHYSFIDDGNLYFYNFTDEQIAHLGIEKYVDDIVVQPESLTEPDQSLIKMLETQWAYSNEIINFRTKPYDSRNLSILDQVEEVFANGNIVYISLHKRGSGHALNGYKMEFDKYDPNLIRIYVYDSNFPYGRLKKQGAGELYINIYKRKKNTLFGVKEYFEFDYTPFEKQRPNYSYSNVDKNHEIRFYFNDQALTGM